MANAAEVLLRILGDATGLTKATDEADASLDKLQAKSDATQGTLFDLGDTVEQTGEKHEEAAPKIAAAGDQLELEGTQADSTTGAIGRLVGSLNNLLFGHEKAAKGAEDNSLAHQTLSKVMADARAEAELEGAAWKDAGASADEVSARVERLTNDLFQSRGPSVLSQALRDGGAAANLTDAGLKELSQTMTRDYSKGEQEAAAATEDTGKAVGGVMGFFQRLDPLVNRVGHGLTLLGAGGGAGEEGMKGLSGSMDGVIGGFSTFGPLVQNADKAVILFQFGAQMLIPILIGLVVVFTPLIAAILDFTVALAGAITVMAVGLGAPIALAAGFTALGAATGNLTGQTQQLEDTWKGVADTLGQQVGPIVQQVIPWLEQWAAPVQALGESALHWLGGVLPSVLRMVTPMVQALFPFLRELGDDFAYVTNFVLGNAGAFGGLWQSSLNVVAGAVQGMMHNLVALSTWFFQNLPAFQPIISATFGFLGQVIQTTARILGGLGLAFAKAFAGGSTGGLVEPVTLLVGAFRILGGVLEAIVGAFSGASDASKPLVQALTAIGVPAERARGVLKDVHDVASALATFLSGAVSIVTNFGRQFAATFLPSYHGLSDTLETVRQKLGPLMSSLGQAASSIGTIAGHIISADLFGLFEKMLGPMMDVGHFILNTLNPVLKTLADHSAVLYPLVVAVGVAFAGWKAIEATLGIIKGVETAVGGARTAMSLFRLATQGVTLSEQEMSLAVQQGVVTENEAKLATMAGTVAKWLGITAKDASAAATEAETAKLDLFTGSSAAAKAAQEASTLATEAATTQTDINTDSQLANAGATDGSRLAQIANTIVTWASGAAKDAWSAMTGIATGVQDANTAAVWANTTALLANPITWIVLAIAALVVALVLVVTHWKQVTTAIGELWDKAKQFGEYLLGGLLPSLRAIWTFLKDLFIATWHDLKSALQAVGNWIEGTFLAIWTRLREALDAVAQNAGFKNFLDLVKNVVTEPIRQLGSLLQAVGLAVRNFVLSPGFQAFVDWVKNLVVGGLQTLSGLLQSVSGSVKNFVTSAGFQNFIDWLKNLTTGTISDLSGFLSTVSTTARNFVTSSGFQKVIDFNGKIDQKAWQTLGGAFQQLADAAKASYKGLEDLFSTLGTVKSGTIDAVAGAFDKLGQSTSWIGQTPAWKTFTQDLKDMGSVTVQRAASQTQWLGDQLKNMGGSAQTAADGAKHVLDQLSKLQVLPGITVGDAFAPAKKAIEDFVKWLQGLKIPNPFAAVEKGFDDLTGHSQKAQSDNNKSLTKTNQDTKQQGNLLTQIIHDIGTQIGGLWGIFVGLVTGNWSRMWQGVWQATGLSGSHLGQQFSDLGTNLKNTVSGFLDNIGQQWSDHLDAIKGWVSQHWDDLKNLFQNGLQWIHDWIGQKLEDIRNLWNDALQWIRDLVSSWVQWVKDKWNDLTTGIHDLLSNFWSDVKSGWHTFLTDVENLVSNSLDNVVSFFKGLPGKAADALKDLASQIGGKFHDAMQKAVTPINNFVSGINTLLDKVGIPKIGGNKPLITLAAGGEIPAFAEGGAFRSVGSGFVANEPTYIVRALVGEGEGSGAGPEYVIPTASAHRSNALRLWGEVGNKIGAFAQGGTLGDVMQLGLDAVEKLAAGGAVGTHGGQCVVYVENVEGIHFGVEYARQMAADVNSHDPKVGNIFVSTLDGAGHTGIVNGPNSVIDSNWNLDEIIRIHPLSDIPDIVGYIDLGKGLPSGVQTGSSPGGLSGIASAAIQKLASPLTSAVSGLSEQFGIAGQAVTGIVNQAVQGAESVFGSTPSESNIDSGKVAVSGQLKDWVDQALKLTGEPESWAAALQTIAQHESGGNPNADQGGLTGAAQAHGLFQTIASTFAAYALPGHTNMYDPVDNAVAAIRYIAARYGNPNNTPGIRSLSSGGGYKGYATGGIALTPQLAAVAEEGPEAIFPLRAGMQGGELSDQTDLLQQVVQLLQQIAAPRPTVPTSFSARVRHA